MLYIDDPTHGELPKPRKPVKNINLSHVAAKLMEAEPEGKGWTFEQVTEAEKWYRRFLEICQRFPTFPAVPNYVIDAFWHQHILDTRAYAKDCQEVFGYFLHHYPYFGLNGDAEERDRAFDQTNELYREIFGEDCRELQQFRATNCDTSCGPCNQPTIQSSCKGTGCGNGPKCSPCAAKAEWKNLRILGVIPEYER